MIDPSISGTVLGAVAFPIERSKLLELGRAFHDDDPVWHDAEAAAAAGFDAVPMLPTATVLVDHWKAGGALEHVMAVGADPRRVLHGQVSWEYRAPLFVGDEVTATSRVADVTTREGRRGGAMTLVTVLTDFVRTDGTLAAVRMDTLIETGERT